ncbi:hypothetical protein ABK16_06175 [Vibrio parahaemolyticus]|nr:hypothetical protein ABK16_06175 [Vibrio parahaemolyticus]KYX74539.1 hypothetical protein AU403_03245 [Vibrio parahaemolyticus]KYZ30456.1 hypothetical protein AW041_18560 [Vibrio parahaemolyticus]
MKVLDKGVFAIGGSYHLCQVKPTEEKVTNFIVNERTANKRVLVLAVSEHHGYKFYVSWLSKMCSNTTNHPISLTLVRAASLLALSYTKLLNQGDMVQHGRKRPLD